MSNAKKSELLTPSEDGRQESVNQPKTHLHFDELLGMGATGADGDRSDAPLAPHWATFFNHLDSTGLDDFDRRTHELSRQVRDNGITYNVYADHDGPQRPWSLDLFPLIVNNESWQQIETGAIQRARLLEKVMADVYGPQELLKQGLIPPALVHGHPGYMRSMHDVTPLGNTFLHILALDLARGPDGQWAVISQRTQAPSGLGYLLENRQLISRQFPEAFDALRIQPLAAAYRDLIESLKQLSPAGADAHIALLTPGPYNETYFEHAYLARYLGLTLVEGSDLTVRDDHLFLRTLRGLEPVHILLKRLDDEFLDPLELRADSTLGIPGLLQVIRAKNVVMANAPGSAFLESPALLGFLPALSQSLLGETLQLPAMDTWWCGERVAMDAALSELAHSIIKPTFPDIARERYFNSVLGPSLTQSQRDEWIGRITRQPDAHTVQAYIPLSQMPTWESSTAAETNGHISSHSYMLRVFALSNGHQSWRVLPGGLVRIASNGQEIASLQQGGSSADVWVEGNAQLDLGIPNPPPTPTSPPAQRKRLVTSRAAENLYWLGRYTERSENSVRLAKLCLETLSGEDPSSKSLWIWLHHFAAQQGLIPEGVPSSFTSDINEGSSVIQRRRRVFERTLIGYLSQKKAFATSVGYNLKALQHAASVVRERLSTEQWSTIIRCVQHFDADCELITSHPEYSSVQALQALTNASQSLAAITGAQTDRMTRDDGWQLLSIGRHVERLGFLSAALDLAVETRTLDELPDEGSGFKALLGLFDSTITFQAQHQQSRELSALLDLLVQDNENPRSLAWVARSLRSRLSKLAGTKMGEDSSLALNIPDLSKWDIATLCERNADGKLSRLRECLELCKYGVWNVSDAVGAHYFNHTHLSDQSIGY